jgi:O-antigen ligase
VRRLDGLGLSRLDVSVAVGAATIVIWLAWAWQRGGFFATDWGLLGALLLIVVAFGLVAGARRPPHERARQVALLTLAGFVLWSYLSILWADFPGEALVGADKTLLYAASFAAFASFAWTPRQRAAAIGAFAVGVSCIGAVWLIRVASSTATADYFIDGRLSGPVEYVNASVALWMLGALPALYLASARELPAPARGLFLGLAVLLLQLSLLGQSRAWLAALPATAVVYVLLSRDRPRALIALVLAGAAVLAGLSTLLDVESAARNEASLAQAVDRAAVVVGLLSLTAACAGTATALLESRMGARLRSRVALGVGVTVVAAALVGGVAAAGAADDPGGWFSGRWEDFSAGDYPAEGDRFASLGSNRLDEWRVAWNEFEEHPVTGIGADNYAAAYLRERDNAEFRPRYPHSTPLRQLSQLGLVGALLFATFVSAAVVLALRRRRELDPLAAGVAGACLTVLCYWALHGSADWLWEVPAVTAPALGFLGLGGAPEHETQRRGPRYGAASTIAGAAVLLVGLVALLVPWLAASYQAAGIRVWRENPSVAHDRLERAADVNPLAAEPLVVDGAIAIRTGDFARAERSFLRARDREAENWYVHYELGVLAGGRAERKAALRSLRRALELNPQERAIRRAIGLVRRGQRLDPRQLGVLVAADGGQAVER